MELTPEPAGEESSELATPKPTVLEVGRVSRPHGLRGEVVVVLVTDRVERVAPGSVLDVDGGSLRVVASRPHQRNHIVSFDGISDRGAAEALRGATLRAPAIEDATQLWVHELIGAPVVTVDGVVVGVIETIEANPASDMLVLDNGALVPAAFVVEQRDDTTVVIDPPEGLFDL
ncbi:MAG TPA: ribosome maturation factor RimM [Acidimicrobiales bacterium]|nr:ribosome maturation factor RimM [Acidimicrobiales bacterium]